MGDPTMSLAPAAVARSIAWAGWPLILTAAAIVTLVAAACWPLLPAWGHMWLLACGLFGAMKLIAWRDVAADGQPRGELLAWLFAWPGLDARAFCTKSLSQKHCFCIGCLGTSAASPQFLRVWGRLGADRQAPEFGSGIGTKFAASTVPSSSAWRTAWLKLALGVVMIWGLIRWLPNNEPLWIGWSGMAGLVLLLHCGLFHLLALAWRRAGRNVRPLMDSPLKSVSLMEFWSRRWNLAFRDFSHRFVFLPAVRRWSARRAALAVFAFSGIAHDLVISVPARGGWGLPTLYFLLQAGGVSIQRSQLGRRLGLDRGSAGRVGTALMLLLPLPLLFHRPFASEVIIPMLRAIGALA
jgi:hypothetical protein